MKQKLQFYVLSALFLMSVILVRGQVRITEAMSSSGTGGKGTSDWFEVTNLGATEVDITGWKVDDSSFAFASSLALNGITTIPAGKSVIFFEVGSPTVDVAAFKTFWGSSLDNVSVGTYSGSGIGLSSSGDGLVLFKADGTEVTRVSFGAATTGSSFYWSYSSDGTMLSAATGVISTVGTINGTISNQVTLTSANELGNIASPGTAIIFPINANVNNPDFKSWSLAGKTLTFDILPINNIEVFSLIGSKVAVYEPTQTINLAMMNGIYFLKIDGKSTKILLK
jgi:hypothetical protein